MLIFEVFRWIEIWVEENYTGFGFETFVTNIRIVCDPLDLIAPFSAEPFVSHLLSDSPPAGNQTEETVYILHESQNISTMKN